MDHQYQNIDDHVHAEHVHPQPHGHEHERDHGRGGRLVSWLKNYLLPHSHDPADTVDDALSASVEGMRALKLSLIALALTAAAQVVVVVITGSVALLADTIHNFSDALTAVPLGVAFILARRPATRRYTYGYGRAEDLAGIFIIAMIALSAGVAAWVAMQRLIHPRDIEYYGMVVIAGLIGFAGNEFAANYRIRVGRRIGSAALVADGLHARTDALTSLAVVLGALGTKAGWRLADPIIGLLISVAILVVLRQAARDVYRRLMDSVDPTLVDTVEATLIATAGVKRVDAVRLRWVGHELFGEAEIVFDGALSLADAHDITDRARHDLLHRVARLTDIIIHSSPAMTDVSPHGNIRRHHIRRVRPKLTVTGIDEGLGWYGAAMPTTKPEVIIPSETPPTELILDDLVVGSGDEATRGKNVSVHYVGVAWSNGIQFDASWDRDESFDFRLGAGQVISGWDDGVAGMKVGGRRRLTIPPEMGYGSRGAGGVIKGGETLVFVVDLLNVF